jgi:hypothetical protein
LPDEQTSLSEASANATLLARADIARLAPVELLARADCSIRLDVGYDDNVVHESSSRWPLCATSGRSITAILRTTACAAIRLIEIRFHDSPRAIYERLDRRAASRTRSRLKSAGPWIFAAKPHGGFNGHRENSATDCSNCLKLPRGLPAIAREPLGARCRG